MYDVQYIASKSDYIMQCDDQFFLMAVRVGALVENQFFYSCIFHIFVIKYTVKIQNEEVHSNGHLGLNKNQMIEMDQSQAENDS